MKTFKDIGINEEINGILAKLGFETPTPIQEESIPLILEGRDIIGQAETGSGKTAACGIPVVQMIDRDVKDIQAMILTPTRELAIQYLNEISSIAVPYGVKPFVIYGGFDMDIQMSKLRQGVQILVATPGRISDIIYNCQFPLSNIKTFIIDEADEMLKMGFIEDVDFIKKCIVQDHQTLLFSATMPPQIKELAQKYLKNAEHIKLNSRKEQPDTLSHRMISVSGRDKEKALRDLLKDGGITQAIIFCNTRRRVEELYRKVKRDIKGTDYLHGGLRQSQRTSIMNRFRKKRIRYIITTDVMARGMDVGGVSHIINYDITDNPETYIHRSGRTARMGREGVSISFVSKREEDKYEEIRKRSGIEPKKKKQKKIFRFRKR